MIWLNEKESAFYQRFLELKREAGNHSPSIYRLIEEFPEVSIKIDACFLCNPYAFDSFYQKFQEVDLQPFVKFYPPQNQEVAKNISAFTGISAERILVGNGAIELIETLMNKLGGPVCMALPTFSTYYEVASIKNVCHYYQLDSANDFQIDVNDYIRWLSEKDPQIVVLVNPNNPTGTILKSEQVKQILDSLRPDQTLIVDESFIHFSAEEESVEHLTADYENLIIIRSLSKDFGIAGLRVGYAVLSQNLRNELLSQGFLWNSNGIAYYFTTLLADPEYQKIYRRLRKKYNEERDEFYQELLKINKIRVYPSSANFFMVETSEDSGILFSKLLYGWGIYTRILNDKQGLTGNFIRIASKDRRENQRILKALHKIYNE
jgi:histidinol-phosphate/aromatic aminotransferase/cobyric acid decarboxylase-like protein